MKFGAPCSGLWYLFESVCFCDTTLGEHQICVIRFPKQLDPSANVVTSFHLQSLRWVCYPRLRISACESSSYSITFCPFGLVSVPLHGITSNNELLCPAVGVVVDIYHCLSWW